VIRSLAFLFLLFFCQNRDWTFVFCRVLFGEENVGLLTGDAAVNREAPILIMTTEILRNMLYQSVGSIEEGGRLMDVDVVVLDEVHYLSDISRGTVWEETVL
jgi:superfamily II RNA helicase